MNNEEIRNAMMKHIMELLAEEGEDPQQTKGNKFMFPGEDEKGNEFYYEITVAIPTGTRDGEPYNGYQEAEDFRIEQEEKEMKRKIREEKKEAAIKKQQEKQEERKKIAEAKKTAKEQKQKAFLAEKEKQENKGE